MQPQDIQNRSQLAMAALMFFSPLVQNIIKKKDMWLSLQDTKFVKGYIRLWYFSLILLLITIISGVVSYQINSWTIDTIYTISITITILILIIGTLAILTNTNILSWDKRLIDLYQENITNDKKETVLKYLPLYNIYLRYKEHNFNTPDIFIKESILARILFCIIWLMTTPFWTSIILILIILRVASLLGNIDIMSPKIKEYINKIFIKNPEELRWYIRGWLVYVYKRVTTIELLTLNETVEKAKKDFSLLYNVQLHNSVHIKIQYLLLVVAIGIWISKCKPDFSLRTTTIPVIIILGRYLIMFIRWNHVPALPIFKEITDLLIYLWEKLHPIGIQIRNHLNNRQ